MSPRIDRRQFVQHSLVATGMLAGGYFINPSTARGRLSANERLNIAAIGATGRAGANIQELKSQNIVAIADVDESLLEKGAAPYPGARKYRDFRVMLEKEAPNIDAVVIGTPDHCHAPAAAMALRLKKHVYCEKPLTHTVLEARTLANLARENKLVTQMGTQIHAGSNYRRVVELVQSGAIGPVREVHVWVNTVYGGKKLTTNTKPPANLDWNLWLGPAPERPYSEGVHPFHWRNFWDYGTGTLGDFGCHYLDLVHWALKLHSPSKIAAQGPAVDAENVPLWVTAQYEYPARGSDPAVRVHWYDGGKQPAMLDAWLKTAKTADGKPLSWPSGQLFLGDKGMLLSNYGEYRLLPSDKFADFKPPAPTIPDSIGHHNEWVQAIKAGGETTCNFHYSGALTEAVMLGVVAYRSGKTLEWNAADLKVTNAPSAQALIHKEYRKGWTL